MKKLLYYLLQMEYYVAQRKTFGTVSLPPPGVNALDAPHPPRLRLELGRDTDYLKVRQIGGLQDFFRTSAVYGHNLLGQLGGPRSTMLYGCKVFRSLQYVFVLAVVKGNLEWKLLC